MKPKALNENDDGMLEYLEDIIGSSRLKVIIFPFLGSNFSNVVATCIFPSLFCFIYQEITKSLHIFLRTDSIIFLKDKVVFTFKVPIETIQRKIDQLQEERSAQLNRTKFAEKEKNDAEGPMKNLIADLRVDNGIALTKNRLLQADR